MQYYIIKINFCKMAGHYSFRGASLIAVYSSVRENSLCQQPLTPPRVPLARTMLTLSLCHFREILKRRPTLRHIWRHIRVSARRKGPDFGCKLCREIRTAHGCALQREPRRAWACARGGQTDRRCCLNHRRYCGCRTFHVNYPEHCFGDLKEKVKLSQTYLLLLQIHTL